MVDKINIIGEISMKSKIKNIIYIYRWTLQINKSNEISKIKKNR